MVVKKDQVTLLDGTRADGRWAAGAFVVISHLLENHPKLFEQLASCIDKDLELPPELIKELNCWLFGKFASTYDKKLGRGFERLAVNAIDYRDGEPVIRIPVQDQFQHRWKETMSDFADWNSLRIDHGGTDAGRTR